ncbi:unnamed protein product [Gadus morhua 'NCC']
MSGDSLQECKGELLSSCFDSGGISHLLWRGLLGEQRWTADRMGRYRLGEKAGSVLGWPLDPEEAPRGPRATVGSPAKRCLAMGHQPRGPRATVGSPAKRCLAMGHQVSLLPPRAPHTPTPTLPTVALTAQKDPSQAGK